VRQRLEVGEDRVDDAGAVRQRRIQGGHARPGRDARGILDPRAQPASVARGEARRVELGADAPALAVDAMALAAVHAEGVEACARLGGGGVRRRHPAEAVRGADQIDPRELVRPAVVALLADRRVVQVLPHQVERRELDRLPLAGLVLADAEGLLVEAREGEPRTMLQHAPDRDAGLVAVGAVQQQLLLVAPARAVDRVEDVGEPQRAERHLAILVRLEHAHLPGLDALPQRREVERRHRLAATQEVEARGIGGVRDPDPEQRGREQQQDAGLSPPRACQAQTRCA
jgi:hypothetical protein